MNNLGSAVGQKMRSAVKAKLVELGTGGSAGYIDDELPDYVMIMVANKRSKQQMITDLTLFLGEQTDLFVTWLHEVLQKLQEVTLPAIAETTASTGSSNKKRKTSKDDAITAGPSSSKKDKKSSKREKDKKTNSARKSAETGGNTPPTRPPAAATAAVSLAASSGSSSLPINSINDVFAGELLEKAKKTLTDTASASAQIKKAKAHQQKTTSSKSASNNNNNNNNFDIPTISEISSTTGGGGGVNSSREKDLAELAEIQRKIYEAKKQLKQRGQLPTSDADSEDEDFLKLKVDDNEENVDSEASEQPTNEQNKAAMPQTTTTASITAKAAVNAEETDESSLDKLVRDDQSISLSTAPSTSPKQREETQKTALKSDYRREPNEQRAGATTQQPTSIANKRPVHERLGMRSAQSSRTEDVTRERQTRQEKELYVPAHRRRETTDVQRQRSREPERQKHDRDRERERERQRERDREREHDRRTRERFRHAEQIEGPRLPERPFAHLSNSKPHMNLNRKRSHSNEHEREREHNESTQRQRIGSRIIVAPVKPIETEEEPAKPVHSVIKIKPRAPTSPSKQASKNLLLRAMAEAQRSTVLAKANKVAATAISSNSASGKRKQRSPANSVKIEVRNQHYGRKFKELLQQKQNLVIKVEGAGVSKKITDRLGERVSVRSEETEMTEEYVPERLTQKRGSLEPLYRKQRSIKHESGITELADDNDDDDVLACVPDYELFDAEDEDVEVSALTALKTQFVITIDDKAPMRIKDRLGLNSSSRSRSPLPQVSSTSSAARRHERESNSRNRLRLMREARSAALKNMRLSKHDAVVQQRETDSSNSSASCTTPPPQMRSSNRIEIYHKPKNIKKIIIKNDSEDEDSSPTKIRKELEMGNHHNNNNNNNNNSTSSGSSTRKGKRAHSAETPEQECRSKKPKQIQPQTKSAEKRTHANSNQAKSPTPTAVTPAKRKRTPIKFDLDQDRDANRKEYIEHKQDEHDERAQRKRQNSSCSSIERQNSAERRKISIRSAEATKYDNIPALSSVSLDSSALKVIKPRERERCKYHPNCTKQFCEYYHPTALCKSFPNCKYGEKCLYSHPQCKYDMACTNLDCVYSHSGVRNPSQLTPQAPPLSSHVVPVQNYKSISAPTSSTAMCKYYPNCNKLGCTFFHPKPCYYGKNCNNKLECNFYHHELQSANKFKWVASVL